MKQVGNVPSFAIGGKLLQDEIADSLRRAIIAGQLLPGQRLIEADLADQFGVSRAPLREALRQLTANGLLNNIPRKGTFVVELTDKDIREIYSLRLALETVAVEILVESLTPTQVDALEGVIGEMEKALKEQNMWSVIQLDMRFHELICQFSEHTRLYKVWMRMSDQLRSFFAAAEPLYEDRQIIERHRELVDSLTSGDRERAVAALREHIVNAADRMLARLGRTSTQETDKEK